MLAADALDHLPQRLPRRGHHLVPLVPVEAAARPPGVGGQRIARRARHRGGRPAGGDLRLPHARQRQPQRLVEGQRPAGGVRHVPRDVVLTAHHLVAQRLGERPGDTGGHRGDQPDPVARQPGGEHRHRHDDPPAQTGDLGVAAHHVAVRQHVRAADVEGPVDVGRHRGRGDQVAQHVAHRDGLGTGVHPAGRDHHGQPLGQIAQHLERRRPRADDDGRPQHGRGHRRVEEDPPHLGTGPQMRRERVLRHPVRGEPAEVDDPAHPGRVRLLGERAGRPAVGVLEVRAAAQRVDQVVRHVDAPHRRGHGRRVGDVAAHRLDVRRPGVVAQLVGRRARPRTRWPASRRSGTSRPPM
ncbi:hypothetical protein SALBM217S_02633 [Streptomyces griseoloalbus]